MANRFGRKQRRRMRAQIAELERWESESCRIILSQQERLSANAADAANLAEFIQAARDWDARVQSIFGRFSALKFDLARLQSDRVEYAMRGGMPSRSVSFENGLKPAVFRQYAERMLKIGMRLDYNDSFEASRLLMVALTDMDGRGQEQRVGYAFSESMWQVIRLGHPDGIGPLTRDVAERIMRLLAKQDFKIGKY